jgi:hypothetical protein
VSPPLPSGLPLRPGVDYESLNYPSLVREFALGTSGVVREVVPESAVNARVLRRDTAGIPMLVKTSCKMNWDVDPPPCTLYFFFRSGQPLALVYKHPAEPPPVAPNDGATFSVDQGMVNKFYQGGYNH